MSDTPVYLQAPCAICGQPTDLPAVWTCACGQYRLCYRSPCHMKIPTSHRDGACAHEEATNEQEVRRDETAPA